MASKMTAMMDVVTTITIVVMMMKMIMMVITIMKTAITGKLIAIRELTNLNMASNFELVSCRARGAGGMVREAP